ncbi:hypothetical protein PV620_30255 [Streptomyces sp. ME02-6978a]|uniref:hypothetical protein n=1 Tax=unclassified Streptomyces TaxID=2593676 RepID=UPI0029A9030F|nr:MULTISPECIES: hypothetical protein [unclassified Streptomyces]MDX3087189.1 hypothetical protein [Streptomyces sp. ME12-02E]MDX3335831.1 hypothetical protein [Streptomyces sp. ME02-6978a]
MDARFDMSDVRRLERHLARSIPRLRREARAVTLRGAQNIKKDWRANARATARKHGRFYPRTVGYDFAAYGPDLFMAVIGPDKGGTQGPLGAILEYGSVKNPPHRDGGRALDAETPRFEAQMAALAMRGLAWDI